MPGMIRFEGTLTPELYRRAVTRQMAPIRLTAVMWIAAAVFVLLSAKLDRPLSWAVPVAFIVAGVWILMTPRISARRAFATDRLVSERMTGEADEEGVRIESAHGRADLPWASMHKVVITADLVLLYQSAVLARILPREFFADDEAWQSFRRLAAAAVPPVRSRRPLAMFALWIAIIVVVFLLRAFFGSR